MLVTGHTRAVRPEASALRDFADLLDANPDLPMTDHVPVTKILGTYDESIELRKRLGGVWQVTRDADYLVFERWFGPICLRILTLQQFTPALRAVA